MSMVDRTLPRGGAHPNFGCSRGVERPARQLQNAVPIGIQYAYKLRGNCRLNSGRSMIRAGDDAERCDEEESRR
jgi:hypothetical protein